MEEHDYPIEHFRMMVEIAVRMKSIPAFIHRHEYHYESFDSWWFSYKCSGKFFRVVFDGRDRFLRLERDGSKIIREWETQSEKQVSDMSVDSIISEVFSLINS